MNNSVKKKSEDSSSNNKSYLKKYFNKIPQIKFTKTTLRLIKNLFILGAIGTIIYFAFSFFAESSDTTDKISDTPIHIEAIKAIAEISTVSYRDEVVIDSLERYGDNVSLYSLEGIAKEFTRNVKRRLTLIVRGEVIYGLDLSDGNFEIVNSDPDTLWLKLPKTKMLNIVVSPSQTEIFQEQGHWSDYTRKFMEKMAMKKLKQNSINLKLNEKAQENAEKLFRKLIKTEKEIIINFE
ncbi:MAG: DUF4230 domain-containing protein [Crocinitomicaceae bacterium]|nr:DUF4230 domain-containing protein [Crocinitomicaceae bacterium]